VSLSFECSDRIPGVGKLLPIYVCVGGLHPRGVQLALKDGKMQPAGFSCEMMNAGRVERWEVLMVECGEMGEETRGERMYWCFYQQNTLCRVFCTLYRVSPFSIRRNFS
jgi:hypothetical protein